MAQCYVLTGVELWIYRSDPITLPLFVYRALADRLTASLFISHAFNYQTYHSSQSDYMYTRVYHYVEDLLRD